jgi:hypothetical protein
VANVLGSVCPVIRFPGSSGDRETEWATQRVRTANAMHISVADFPLFY